MNKPHKHPPIPPHELIAEISSLDTLSIMRLSLSKTIPIMMGYIPLGMGFGILLESKGYGLIWSALMAIFIYSGAMQYVTINLLSSGATLIDSALAALTVNARHIFYSTSMLDKFNKVKGKFYLIFTLTDESYSILSNKLPEGINNNKSRRTYYLCISLFNYFYWLFGCALGSLIGSKIAFNTAGLDFAMTALFITIFTDQWINNKNHKPAIIGVVSSICCLIIFGAKHFLIPSLIIITIVLSLIKRPSLV